MKIKQIKEYVEKTFILVLLLAVSLYALGLKNGVYDEKEKIEEETNLSQDYSENEIVIRIQPFDKHSSEKVYNGTNEFLKGEIYMEKLTIKELKNYLCNGKRVSVCYKHTYDFINFRYINYVPKIFDDLCVDFLDIRNCEFPDLIEGRKSFPCIEIIVSAEVQQMIQTLNDLEYECILNNDEKIIYRKVPGFETVTLELDIKSKTFKKYVNDYMQKVEIAPDDIEITLMKKLID